MPIVLLFTGLALGPTLHYLAWRSSRWEPFSPYRAACERCGHPLRLLGLIERRCPSCGQGRRLRREIIMSLVTGAGFLAAGWLGGGPVTVTAHLLLAAVTVVLFRTDLDEKLIPNRILYPGGTAAVLVLGLAAVLTDRLPDFGWAMVMGLGYFLMFWLVALVARGGFGYGDVKLAALLGVFAGYPGWRHFAVSIFLTGMIGGIPAILLLVTRQAGPKTELPYGPAMILGCWGALLFGSDIIGRV